jgi:hypothetical protein
MRAKMFTSSRARLALIFSDRVLGVSDIGSSEIG